MRIGYDAKRVFHNRAGLGNYSRNLLLAMNSAFPDTEFYLFDSKHEGNNLFSMSDNMHLETPGSVWKHVPSLWRSFGSAASIKSCNLDLYHGLSHELPYGLKSSKLPTVVTIHDLIFVHHPEWYNAIDRRLYTLKYKSSCKSADRVVAISTQTANDLKTIWNIDPQKIDVVHQGCNPIYWNPISTEKEMSIIKKYNLPSQYMLCVGTIEERKNHLNILKAISCDEIDIPLVIVGRPTAYLSVLNDYIVKMGIEDQIIFLHNVQIDDLPALYHGALLSIYASKLEGFGIPVLESIVCGTPVVTSNGSCFKDAGGHAALYANPNNHDEIASKIIKLASDSTLRNDLIEKGVAHAKKFTPETIARNMMRVYKKTIELKNN